MCYSGEAPSRMCVFVGGARGVGGGAGGRARLARVVDGSGTPAAPPMQPLHTRGRSIHAGDDAHAQCVHRQLCCVRAATVRAMSSVSRRVCARLARRKCASIRGRCGATPCLKIRRATCSGRAWLYLLRAAGRSGRQAAVASTVAHAQLVQVSRRNCCAPFDSALPANGGAARHEDMRALSCKSPDTSRSVGSDPQACMWPAWCRHATPDQNPNPIWHLPNVALRRSPGDAAKPKR